MCLKSTLVASRCKNAISEVSKSLVKIVTRTLLSDVACAIMRLLLQVKLQGFCF